MNHIEEAIWACVHEIREVKEAIEKLIDRISTAADLWQPSPTHKRRESGERRDTLGTVQRLRRGN